MFTRSGSTWIQEGKKLAGADEAWFGSSVALSADGNTILIGGLVEGAAWVFLRSGSSWVQQGEKLTGRGEDVSGEFGSSGALSADGNTALIGGPVDNAAWVFTRSGSTWTQQGNKLAGGRRVADFGESVSLSADGNTALVGGDGGGPYAGAALIFTRAGAVWARHGKLAAYDETVPENLVAFGWSVALSSNGNTALVGGWNDNTNGAAWLFSR